MNLRQSRPKGQPGEKAHWTTPVVQAQNATPPSFPGLVGLVQQTGTPALRPQDPDADTRALVVLPAKTTVFESAVGIPANAAPPRQRAAAPLSGWGNFEIWGSTIEPWADWGPGVPGSNAQRGSGPVQLQLLRVRELADRQKARPGEALRHAYHTKEAPVFRLACFPHTDTGPGASLACFDGSCSSEREPESKETGRPCRSTGRPQDNIARHVACK